MNVRRDIEMLQQHLERLAGEADTDLAQRYALRPLAHGPLSLYRKLRVALGRKLRQWGLRRTRPPEPWLPGLRHFEHDERAEPLVIWAVGADRDTLRAACSGFANLFAATPGFVPVLVTDVADFAFFSRLGWLVEYIPELSAPADDYAARKERYLALRYRGAPALPVSAGLADDVRLEDLLQAATAPQ